MSTVMKTGVLATGKNHQIVQRVVQFIAVYMVDYFRGAQSTLQVFLKNCAMLKNALPLNVKTSIAVDGNITVSIRRASQIRNRISISHKAIVVIGAPTAAFRAFVAVVDFTRSLRSFLRIDSRERMAVALPQSIMRPAPATSVSFLPTLHNAALHTG